MTLTAELNQKAKAILIRELGPVDYSRFIQQLHYFPSKIQNQQSLIHPTAHSALLPSSQNL
jgi:hypothetical protein